MKKNFLLLIITLATLNIFSQEKFSFNDTNVLVNSIKIIEAVDFSNEINKYYFDSKQIDSLAFFLNNNLAIKIEIICNSDFEDTPLLSMMVTSDQAMEIRNYLIKKEIKGTRIKIYGNGNMNPIISEDEMVYLDEEGIEKANKTNRRIEIIITENNPIIVKKDTPSKGVRSYPNKW